MKRSSFTILNFNTLQDDVYIDFQKLIYYPNFEKEEEFKNPSSYQFLFEISQLAGLKKIKKRKMKKFKKNKRVEKIERLKKKSNKKAKIILSTLINHETTLSKAAKGYYG